MNESIIDYNYLDISLEYLENTSVTAGATATYTLTLYYEQPQANNN